MRADKLSKTACTITIAGLVLTGILATMPTAYAWCGPGQYPNCKTESSPQADIGMTSDSSAELNVSLVALYSAIRQVLGIL